MQLTTQGENNVQSCWWQIACDFLINVSTGLNQGTNLVPERDGDLGTVLFALLITEGAAMPLLSVQVTPADF